jgi:hypothetical protein
VRNDVNCGLSMGNLELDEICGWLFQLVEECLERDQEGDSMRLV